ARLRPGSGRGVALAEQRHGRLVGVRELSPTNWDMLEQVVGQVGQPEVIEDARARPPQLPAALATEATPADAFALLAGRRVGVSTPFEPPGFCARDIIQRHCRTCEVIRVSKHMATEPIEDIRRDLGKPTVRVIGASASSIVRELETTCARTTWTDVGR